MTTGYPREYKIMEVVSLGFSLHWMDDDNAYQMLPIQVQTVHSPEVSVSST